jgi:5-methylcytosine-specific restriction endonuclease McrA
LKEAVEPSKQIKGHSSAETAAEQKRAKERARYAANREKIKAQVAAYRAANPEKIKELSKKRRLENLDAINEYQAAYRERHREKNRLYAIEYRKNNKEKVKAAVERWHQANPDCRKVIKANRRKAAIGLGRLSVGISEKLFTLQRGRCATCEVKLEKTGHHIDHVVPLSRGGKNSDDNVQLLCPTCNMKKGATDPIVWANRNGKLI